MSRDLHGGGRIRWALPGTRRQGPPRAVANRGAASGEGIATFAENVRQIFMLTRKG